MACPSPPHGTPGSSGAAQAGVAPPAAGDQAAAQEERSRLDDAPRGTAYSSMLLRLEDEQLEREYWAQGPFPYDWASVLVTLGMQAFFLKGILPQGLASGGDELAAHASAFRLPHLVLLSAMLAQLTMMMLAPRAYARHRVTVQLLMQTARCGFQIWQGRVSSHAPALWRARLMAPGADPRRALNASLLILPLIIVQHAWLNPLPLRVRPGVSLVLFLIYLSGWFRISTRFWALPWMEQAVAELCGRMSDLAAAADSTCLVAFGAPVASALVAWDRPATPERCTCVVQVVAVAAYVSIAVVIPICVSWRVELNAKRRFLRARGLRLRARSSKALEGLAAWLGARGLQLQLPSLLYAPALVLAPPLVVWQLCEAIVLIVSPDCRASARS